MKTLVKMREARYKLMVVRPEELLSLCFVRKVDALQKFIFDEIKVPEDSEIIGVDYRVEYNAFLICLFNKNWPIVGEAIQPPRISFQSRALAMTLMAARQERIESKYPCPNCKGAEQDATEGVWLMQDPNKIFFIECARCGMQGPKARNYPDAAKDGWIKLPRETEEEDEKPVDPEALKKAMDEAVKATQSSVEIRNYDTNQK